MQTEVLLFQVGDRHFGVRSQHVQEVVRAASLSPLPRPADCIEGMLNLRGNVVPVLDLRAVFDLPRRALCVTDHLVIVACQAELLTLRVDHAIDLVSVVTSELTRPSVSAGAEFITATGKQDDLIFHILDVESLFASYIASTPSARPEGLDTHSVAEEAS